MPMENRSVLTARMRMQEGRVVGRGLLFWDTLSSV